MTPTIINTTMTSQGIRYSNCISWFPLGGFYDNLSKERCTDKESRYYLVTHQKQDDETSTGFRHTSKEVSLLLRPVGTTEHTSELALKLPKTPPWKNTACLLQLGLFVLTVQSIRCSCCFVKYLYYLIYSLYEKRIFSREKILARISSIPSQEVSFSFLSASGHSWLSDPLWFRVLGTMWSPWGR